jgi:hypothetical protein
MRTRLRHRLEACATVLLLPSVVQASCLDPWLADNACVVTFLMKLPLHSNRIGRE